MLVVAAFGLIAPSLLGSDMPVAPPGYKLIPIGTGSSKSYVSVKDTSASQGLNNRAAPSNEKYDPSAANFGKASVYANKTFDSNTYLTSRDSSFQASQKRTFVTQPYLTGHNSSRFQDKSAQLPDAALGYDRRATDTDKNYDGLKGSSLSHQALFSTQTSSYQGEKANLGNRHTDTYASTLAKPYSDPNLKIVRHQDGGPPLMADDGKSPLDGSLRIRDLPDRPLSIDEVRALINNGTRPDTDAPPEPASKPLNDPDYRPVPRPAFDDQPSPTRYTPSVDDKNDPVPSPGTMALPPENSEPLPK